MEAAKLIDDDDPELSMEERVFRMWMNSLDLGEDFYINNLIQDLRDGVVLTKVMNKLKPGCVDEKKL